MADKKPGRNKAARKSFKRKTAAKKAGAKNSSEKQTAAKKVASKQVLTRSMKVAAKRSVSKSVSARKPVPIKTARVGKRAILPPLPPPPTAPLKSTRSPARRSSRAKPPVRSNAKASLPVGEIGACTEAALREKLRLAAAYVAVWLARRESESFVPDLPSPEAAFVRIWQWLTLEATLEDRRIVSADLVAALFAEEAGSARP